MARHDVTKTHRRILVVANETVEGSVLHEAIRLRARGADAEVRVIAPALNSRLRHWLSDEDEARRVAERRLASCLERLALAGIAAHGDVGDADPIQAIADALHSFRADEIVVATHPETRSHWLSRNVVDRARSRFGLPVLHIVVDRVAGAEPATGKLADKRVIRGLRGLVAAIVALATAAALASASSALAAPTATVLRATVGPGFTITLKNSSGKIAKTLKAGTYTIAVRDLSDMHNFHLSGPGLNRATSVAGTGSTTWTAKLKKGTYTYVCDPHASTMRGTFTVK